MSSRMPTSVVTSGRAIVPSGDGQIDGLAGGQCEWAVALRAAGWRTRGLATVGDDWPPADASRSRVPHAQPMTALAAMAVTP